MRLVGPVGIVGGGAEERRVPDFGGESRKKATGW